MMLLNESPTSARLNRRTPVNMFPPDESDNDDDDDDQEQDMSLAVGQPLKKFCCLVPPSLNRLLMYQIPRAQIRLPILLP